MLKEISLAESEHKNIILLSTEKNFWANENSPKGFGDFKKRNYCYVESDDQFKDVLLKCNFKSQKKRPISYHSKNFNIGIEIKVCNLFEQQGIRVIHCMNDFESNPKHIYPGSVFGQFLSRCQKRGIQISDCIEEQLSEIESKGQYKLKKRKTHYYPLGTTLRLSLGDEQYRIVSFNHWKEDEVIRPYTVKEYRDFLGRLWDSLKKEGKNSTINLTLMGNNYTTFSDTQPYTEQKIWMILESLFAAARQGFMCDLLRICIRENDVNQIGFTDLTSILRYLDEKQG